MFISEYFTYDGIQSTEFDIKLVRLSGGLIDGSFGMKQKILEQKAQNNPVPYFIKTEKEPLELNLVFAKMSPWTEEDRRNVVEWLFQDEYKPLISSDDTGVVYYCQPIDDVTRFYTGLNEGYIEIRMRCDAPYGWSYPIQNQTYDLRSGGTNLISMDNLSNVNKYYYPEIEIELYGTSTSFSLKNLSDGGRITEFTNLQTEETIYLNNKRKQIITDVPNIYRYLNFNNNWLRLIKGRNHIEVSGECIIKTKMQFPIAR